LARSRSRPRSRPSREVLGIGSPERSRSTWVPDRLAVEDLAPLPGAGRELKELQRRTSPQSVFLIGDRANEAELRRQPLADFRALHFATHAVLDSRIPARSAIVLGGPAAGEDGLLGPREIHELPLAAELVVLSGCRTADGRDSPAEGVQSLAGAFLGAGARSVIGTSWPVRDSGSVALVGELYRELEQDGEVAAALRQALLRLAGTDPWGSSRDWAGFLLLGDPASRPELGRPPLRSRLRAWGPALAALLVAVVSLLQAFRPVHSLPRR
jgi:CHAT domain-containing protein